MSETSEEWLYAGQRLDSKDKLFYLWVDPSGEELMFRKLPGTLPGSAYLIDVDRTGDKVQVSGAPRYRAELAERYATERQLELWRAEDKAAKTLVEAKRVEKAAAADDELERALEVLRKHYDRLRSMAKRGAFITYVTGELTRTPRQEKP